MASASEENKVRNERRKNAANERTSEIDETESRTTTSTKASEGTLELPEVLQDYDANAVAKMMERFGLDESDLQNPKFAALVKAALDRGEAEEGLEEENEEGESEEEPVTEQEPEQKPEQQAAEQPQAVGPEEFQRHIAAIRQEIAETDSPLMVEAFRNELAECFGAETPEAKANVDRFANAALIGAHNLVNTLDPRLIHQHLESALSRRSRDWRRVIGRLSFTTLGRMFERAVNLLLIFRSSEHRSSTKPPNVFTRRILFLKPWISKTTEATRCRSSKRCDKRQK